MKELMLLGKNFLRDEEGATAVEYGVIVALIIGVCVLVITTLGTTVRDAFQSVIDAIGG